MGGVPWSGNRVQINKTSKERLCVPLVSSRTEFWCFIHVWGFIISNGWRLVPLLDFVTEVYPVLENRTVRSGFGCLGCLPIEIGFGHLTHQDGGRIPTLVCPLTMCICMSACIYTQEVLSVTLRTSFARALSLSLSLSLSISASNAYVLINACIQTSCI
jgi:hypothetical protein